MIENKISAAEAMQMSLLKAQKKNIEADTNLKEANANKTNGVDTEKAGAEIKNLEATVDKIGEEIKTFRVQRRLMSLEMSVKREEIDKIGQEIQNLKASKELTEQQKESLIISTAQSVLTQKMQRAVMRGELKLQDAQINKMAEDIRQGWKRLEIEEGKNDIEQLFNNWKMDYPGLNDWIGHGLNELEEGMKELIDKIR